MKKLSVNSNGLLDLCNNDLIVQVEKVLPADPTPQDVLDQIFKWVGNARNNPPYWQGMGITSSSAAADRSTLTGLAILLNRNDLGDAIWAEFDGERVDANSIIVKHSWNGDMDCNGAVNALDYARINQGFLSQNTPTPLKGYQNGDLDFSGEVNALDYALINGAFLGQHDIVLAPARAPQRSATFSKAPISAVAAPKKTTASKQRRRKLVVGSE
jgi:hypothetical protein